MREQPVAEHGTHRQLYVRLYDATNLNRLPRGRDWWSLHFTGLADGAIWFSRVRMRMETGSWVFWAGAGGHMAGQGRRAL
jgi:hypothetical protein